jgi:hypothetical protein
MIDSLPGREIMRQKAPGFATAQEIEDGIEQFTT